MQNATPERQPSSATLNRLPSPVTITFLPYDAIDKSFCCDALPDYGGDENNKVGTCRCDLEMTVELQYEANPFDDLAELCSPEAVRPVRCDVIDTYAAFLDGIASRSQRQMALRREWRSADRRLRKRLLFRQHRLNHRKRRNRRRHG